VDNAHLLDELSAVLVHQLVLRRAATVVLTLRAGETAPDAVTALWKDGHLPRLELDPLSQTETATLVESRLGGPVDSAAARRLWSITQGNALYLRQLVDGELEAGWLHQVAGEWQWSGELALSPGPVEFVSARIGQLPEAQRHVVDVLAFGEPLGVSLLAKLTDARAMEQVETRGLIEAYPDRRRLQARLAHRLFSEVQRAQMGTLQARRLRGRIAQASAVPVGGGPMTPLRHGVNAGLRSATRFGVVHHCGRPGHRAGRPHAGRTGSTGRSGRRWRFQAAPAAGQRTGLVWPVG
jgi:hypothetical protein